MSEPEAPVDQPYGGSEPRELAESEPIEGTTVGALMRWASSPAISSG